VTDGTSRSYSSTITITVNNECLTATVTQVSGANDAFTYTLMDPLVNYALTPFATFQAPGANCFVYSLLDSTSTTADTLPALTVATLTFPYLVLSHSTAGFLLSTTASKSYPYSVRISINIAGGTSLYQPLTITLQNECYYT